MPAQPHVLVLTAPGDLHAQRVCAMLADRDVRVTVFDPADLPARARLTARCDEQGRFTHVLHRGEEQVDLAGVTAVWVRKPGAVGSDPALSGPVGALAAAELARLADDVWAGIDRPTLPGTRDTLRVAGQKLAQLRLAGMLGFELPPTLVTTDPDALLDFWDEHEGAVISKPLERPWLREDDGGALARKAEPVTVHDVTAAASAVLCPVIVQRYVPKDVELRVTVVGDRVFAAEIHSQQSNHTRLDWRCYDGATTRHAVHDLPGPVRERCLRLVSELGLRYGAIDLVLTPDRRYVFLEINPNGQWLWIEDATGLPISAAVADELQRLAAPTLPLPPIGALR